MSALSLVALAPLLLLLYRTRKHHSKITKRMPSSPIHAIFYIAFVALILYELRAFIWTVAVFWMGFEIVRLGVKKKAKLASWVTSAVAKVRR